MMSMLTGIEVPDSGDGYIFGKSVTWDLETVRLHIGLCPQFDALVDKLTAREHLVLLAEIRGVPKHLVSRVVERAIADMALTEKAGAVSQTYSGGNKRKLMVAIALICEKRRTMWQQKGSDIRLVSVLSARSNEMIWPHASAHFDCMFFTWPTPSQYLP